MVGYKFGNPKKLTCDIVMGLFLYGMSKLVDKKLYLVLGIFFKELRNCLNDNAPQIIDKYLSQKIGPNDRKSRVIGDTKEFCSENTPIYLPLIADIFVKHISSYPDFELHLAVELIQDFCKWLERKKLTKIRLGRAGEKNEKKNMES